MSGAPHLRGPVIGRDEAIQMWLCCVCEQRAGLVRVFVGALTRYVLCESCGRRWKLGECIVPLESWQPRTLDSDTPDSVE